MIKREGLPNRRRFVVLPLKLAAKIAAKAGCL
jgi:hypothetical protein